MGIKDAVPKCPLFGEEIESLIEDLPEGIRPTPGSAVDTGTGKLLIPTFTITAPDGSVTLFGHSEREEEWRKIESWEMEDYDDDVQAERVHKWAQDHLPEIGLESTIDLE
jgi:hypothetical protein